MIRSCVNVGAYVGEKDMVGWGGRDRGRLGEGRERRPVWQAVPAPLTASVQRLGGQAEREA